MRNTLATVLAAFAVAATVPTMARAAEEHRQLGAHEHGHGTLDIAVEGKRVVMELEVPGMDVAGFEHAPATDAEKAALEQAKARLAKPLALFKPPAAAGCSVTQAKVAIASEHDGHHHDGKHEPGHEDGHGDGHHGHDDAEKGHHDGHDEDGHAKHGDKDDGHSAFRGSYALDCTDPAGLTSITFDYFQAFAGARELTVNVVTAKAQNSYEVSRDAPQLDLGGMM